MSSIGSTRAKIILSVIGSVFLGVGVMLFIKYQWLRVRVAFVDEQIEIFDDMRSRALRAEPTKAVGYFDYVSGYYSSGSKQKEGSKFDQMVEQALR